VKLLLIGDMHVVAEELPECERVGEFIAKTAEQEKPDAIVFLGDQYNNHATVHVRVQEFWLNLFERLTPPAGWTGPTRIAIKGNHDLDPTHGVTAHALQAHRDQVVVVEAPRLIGDILYLPYTHDSEQFYHWVGQAPQASGVICHQTFNGSQYENGFYAKDGLDLERVPQKWIISGHIHAPQIIGKLWYPGAPRWRSASDANTVRGIYLVDFDYPGYTGPAPFVIKRLDTGPFCREIFHAEVTAEKTHLPYEYREKDLWIVDLKGSPEFIAEKLPELKALGARVRTHPTSAAAISIRESEGIGKSFAKHLDGFSPKFGTEKAVLARLAQERLGV
jgi:DNA repair exonuclease SbcCD nuclease subunit